MINSPAVGTWETKASFKGGPNCPKIGWVICEMASLGVQIDQFRKHLSLGILYVRVLENERHLLGPDGDGSHGTA